MGWTLCRASAAWLCSLPTDFPWLPCYLKPRPRVGRTDGERISASRSSELRKRSRAEVHRTA